MSDSEETSSPIDFESYLDKKGHELRAHPPGITHGQESVYFNLKAVDMMNLSKGISVIAAPDTDKEVPQFFVCEVGPEGYTLSGLGEGSGLNTSSSLIENLGEEFQSDNNQWYELEETEMTSQWNTPVFKAILRDGPPSPQEDESTKGS